MPELRVEAHTELPSTNERALERAREGAEAGLLVLAERQSSGRGQRGATWHSPPGGIYASLLLRPALPPERAPLLPLAAGLALQAEVERSVTGGAGLKWPNDLLIARPHPLEGRKLAGILVEASVDGHGLRHVVIGFGLNLRGQPESLEPRAASLEALAGAQLELEPRTMATRIAADMMRRSGQLEAGSYAAVVEAWNRVGLGIGAPIELTEGEARYQGRFLGLRSEDGAPRVALAGGEVRALPHARIAALVPSRSRVGFEG